MGTISEAIRAVKEYIQEFGWTQGNAKSGDSVCLVQAISETTHGYVPQERVEDVLSLAINEFSIVSWNDEPDRTKDQVYAVLDVAMTLPEAQLTL